MTVAYRTNSIKIPKTTTIYVYIYRYIHKHTIKHKRLKDQLEKGKTTHVKQNCETSRQGNDNACCVVSVRMCFFG
jgi:hypothetical protein